MTKKRFEVSDLVQIKSEYEEHDNPSLFRIREIARRAGPARTAQQPIRCTDTWIDLDDPESGLRRTGRFCSATPGAITKTKPPPRHRGPQHACR